MRHKGMLHPVYNFNLGSLWIDPVNHIAILPSSENFLVL